MWYRYGGWLCVITWMIVAPTAQAGWHDWWECWRVDTRRMNCWPEPFASYDRQAARAAFDPFIEAGWQVENTLLDPLFDDQGELTRAGKLRVREILTQYPPHRRALFVAAGSSTEITTRRLESVKQYAAQIAHEAAVLSVSVNPRTPRSGTGDYLNLVSERYRQSLPAPVLPKSAGGNSALGSSSASESP